MSTSELKLKQLHADKYDITDMLFFIKKYSSARACIKCTIFSKH